METDRLLELALFVFVLHYHCPDKHGLMYQKDKGEVEREFYPNVNYNTYRKMLCSCTEDFKGSDSLFRSP